MGKKSATRRVTITNPTGLHARPSLAIVNTVKQHRSKVTVRKDDQVVNAGDILQLLTLGATQGTELVLSAKGPDAEQVLAALAELFAQGFGL